MARKFPNLCVLALILQSFVACTAAASQLQQADADWRWSGVSRIVVLPDVHGAYAELIALLRATDIVDEDLNWRGGDAHLVSLGDMLDRGSDSRAVMDLLMRLQQEAPKAGGRVHVILGNHEQMNLVGDLRFVSAGEFAAFVVDETAAMRDAARRRFADANPDLTPEAMAEAFAKRYPPGYLAHREAFRPGGRYGRWLLSLPTVVVLNDTAFVHGGLPAVTAGWTAAQLNSTFSRELTRYLEVWQDLVARDVLPDDEPVSAQDAMSGGEVVEFPSTCVEDRAESCAMPETDAGVQALVDEFIALSESTVNSYQAPFWYRGSVYCRDILERPVLDDYLRKLDVSRVVVGHTPTADRRVRSIRDGKVIMVDTGMLVSYYKGRPAALVLEDGQLLVQYLDPAQRSAPLSGFGPVAYGLDQSTLQQALTDGVIAGVAKDGEASYWRVSLEFQGTAIEARFFPGGRNGTANQELAAHALDGLLGTELVAATVARTVDGTSGALQLVYPREMSEQARLAAGLSPAGWCPMQDQIQLMYLFDLLIGNTGRSAANVLYATGDWTLRLSEHGRAFNPSGKLPPALSDDALMLSPGVVAALERLDRSQLEAGLGAYLDNRRIRALLSRRDEILKKFAR